MFQQRPALRRISQAAAVLLTIHLTVSPILPYLPSAALVPTANAESDIFVDGFGTGSTDSTFNEAPVWTEDEAGAEKRAFGSGNDTASPNGGRFAVLFGNNGTLCTTVNTIGYTNVNLSYYWRGDSDANSANDNALVEVKPAAGNGCGNNSGWTQLADLDLRDDATWTLQTPIANVIMNNTQFLLRFRTSTNSNDEHLRIDGVKVSGDQTASSSSSSSAVSSSMSSSAISSSASSSVSSSATSSSEASSSSFSSSAISSSVSSSTPTTGTVEIHKYVCPEGTDTTRPANGPDSEGNHTVPAGCIPQAGMEFGYTYQADKEDNSAPYVGTDGEPWTSVGTTDINGEITVPNLPELGRHNFAELNGDGSYTYSKPGLIGLYCVGDPDESKDDNYDVTYVPAGGTTYCIAYNEGDVGGGSSSSSSSSSSGPVACYPENENLVAYWKLDDVETTTAADSSGNNNVATYMNSPAEGAGFTSMSFVNPGSRNFNGTDQYAVVTENNLSSRIGNSFTFSGWFKTTSNQSQVMMRKDNWPSAARELATLDIANNEVAGGMASFHIMKDGTLITTQASSSLADGEEHFIAGVRDTEAGVIRLYVDGVLVDTEVDTLVGQDIIAPNAMHIGDVDGLYPAFAKADMDDLRVYDRALTTEEIAALAGGECDPTPPVQETDLGIQKTMPANVLAGLPFTAQLSVHNFGEVTATNVVVTDLFASTGMSFNAEGSDERCTLQPDEMTIICNDDSIAPGTTETFDLSFNYLGCTGDATVPAQNLLASVTMAQTDTNTENNSVGPVESVNEFCDIGETADVTVNKSVSSESVLQGDIILYTLTVTNNGPATANNVVVTDPIPELLSFMPGNGEPGQSSADCEQVGNDVVCSLEALSADGESGNTHTFYLYMQVDSGEEISCGAGIYNTATVVTGNDVNYSNNVSQTTLSTISCVPHADLSFDKVALADSAEQGDDIAYNLTVSNSGPHTAYSVVITDTPPAGVTFDSDSSPECSFSEGFVTCDAGDIADGESKTFTVKFTTLEPASECNGKEIVNSASVGSESVDVYPENNSDSVSMNLTCPSSEGGSNGGDFAGTAFNGENAQYRGHGSIKAFALLKKLLQGGFGGGGVFGPNAGQGGQPNPHGGGFKPYELKLPGFPQGGFGGAPTADACAALEIAKDQPGYVDGGLETYANNMALDFGMTPEQLLAEFAKCQ